MVLFKVTDAPATHEGLADAGYDVVYGRRLFMEQGETTVTDDPSDVAERDYYTLAYAERDDPTADLATAAFESADSPTATDGGTPTGEAAVERAESEACGDEQPEAGR